MKTQASHDLLLLNRIRKGDHLAFKSLFLQYYPALCHFAGLFLKNHVLAEELVSDLFLRFWESRMDVQVQNVRMYFFTATKNRCLNQLRKARNERLVLCDSDMEQASPGDCPLSKVIFKETAVEIDRLIMLLPGKMRACFIMSRTDGLSYAEIAELFDISVRTVEDHIYKALQILRRAYQEQQSR